MKTKRLQQLTPEKLTEVMKNTVADIFNYYNYSLKFIYGVKSKLKTLKQAGLIFPKKDASGFACDINNYKRSGFDSHPSSSVSP